MTAAPRRAWGPDVGEPPLLVDPRRGGSLVGLAGGAVFLVSSAPALGPVVAGLVLALGLAGVLGCLFLLYVRPRALGPLVRPRPLALAVYLACVVGELALIRVGSEALLAADRATLRPALIAAVVGVHFVPFAWAFQERMFLLLGGVVAVLGTTGLAVGLLGVARAADASAVAAGLAMLGVLAAYAQGRFAPGAPPPGASRRRT